MTATEHRCAVLHAPGYVPGQCAGEVRRYRSLSSTGEWWLCEADAASAPNRGVPVVEVEGPTNEVAP